MLPTYAVPFQAPPSLRLSFGTLELQLIKVHVSHLRHWDKVGDQQNEVTRKSDGFVGVRPRLDVNRCIRERTRNEEEDCVDWDEENDA